MAPNNAQRRSRIVLLGVMAAALIGAVLIGVGKNSGNAEVIAQQALPVDTLSQAVTPAYQPMTGKSEAAASLVKMLVALAVVVLCIYVGVFLLKKFMGKRRTGDSGSLLQIIETAYIDPKKSLSLVRVADRSVLIGVTDNQISVLTELNSQDTQSVMQRSQTRNTDDGFMSMLKSAGDKFRGQGTMKDQSQG